eukprot:COSAG06_NODE_918_length_11551_cov_4.681802_14_plen_171_part_00
MWQQSLCVFLFSVPCGKLIFLVPRQARDKRNGTWHRTTFFFFRRRLRPRSRGRRQHAKSSPLSSSSCSHSSLLIQARGNPRAARRRCPRIVLEVAACTLRRVRSLMSRLGEGGGKTRPCPASSCFWFSNLLLRLIRPEPVLANHRRLSHMDLKGLFPPAVFLLPAGTLEL